MRYHEPWRAEYLEVATWDDGVWAGTQAGAGSVWLFGTRAWIRISLDEVGEPMFYLATSPSLGECALNRGHCRWLMAQCVPPDADTSTLGFENLESVAEVPGELSAGFDPEPHVLLGEVHPIWTSNSRWIHLEEGL